MNPGKTGQGSGALSRSLALEAARERFLDAEQFDPALFSGRSLYLLPDGLAAQHPYLVLSQALHDNCSGSFKWRRPAPGRRASYSSSSG
jgi:hypothetical protein